MTYTAQNFETPSDPLFFVDRQWCQHLRELFEDSQGRLWLGTNVYGLLRVEDGELKRLVLDGGYKMGRITSILEDQEARVWVACYGGVYCFDGDEVLHYGQPAGMTDEEVWAMAPNGAGGYWVGHTYGLDLLDSSGQITRVDYPRPDSLYQEPVFYEERVAALALDDAGGLWIGTDGYGLVYYDGVDFENYSMQNGLVDHRIMSLLMDKAGRLWIGSAWGGLSRFDGKSFRHFTQEGIIKGVEVSALTEDEAGRIWAGVENDGIYIIDQSDTVQHYSLEAVHGASILGFCMASEGHVWLGGWGGMFRLEAACVNPVGVDGPWH